MKLGLLADAHGFVEAFDIALEALRERGAEQCWFLGDAVGYCPGWGVVDALSMRGIPALRGNHEAMYLPDAPAVNRERASMYGLDATMAARTAAHQRWLEALPTSLTMDAPCGRVTAMHGAPWDPVRGYLHAWTPLDDLEGLDADLCFVAHTHRASLRAWRGRTIVNVGSCGLPRDDGRFGSACLLDTVTGALELVRFELVAAWRALDRRCTLHPALYELRQRT